MHTFNAENAGIVIAIHSCYTQPLHRGVLNLEVNKTNCLPSCVQESGLFDFPFAAELRPYPRNLLPGGMLDELVKIHPQQMRLSFTTTGEG